MALLRVDVTPLLRPMRSELLALLASLAGSDWTRETSCPGWDVHAIAAHLLGVELGNVSLRRDRCGVAPAAGEDPGTWLNAFNQQWVDAMRRFSPPLLIEQKATVVVAGASRGQVRAGNWTRASRAGSRRARSAPA